MLNIQLPRNLEKTYHEIHKEYNTIQDDWKKYNDEIIPEDPIFAQKIINFIIGVIDYVLEQYETLNVEKYQEFLAYYDYEFLYGSHGDDRNYLSFDEDFNGVPVSELFLEFKDDEHTLTKEKLEEIKSMYEQVLSQFK